MSFTYLTSDEKRMIGHLLAEIRDPGPEQNFDKQTAAARLLVHAVEQGNSDEQTLRAVLTKHVQLHKTLDNALARWDDEGGAVGKAA